MNRGLSVQTVLFIWRTWVWRKDIFSVAKACRLWKGIGYSIMGKTWNVRLDDGEYVVELMKNRLKVNGAELPLKNYRKKSGFTHSEYEIPLGYRTVRLVIVSMGVPQLIIDNKDYETGKEYVPIKMPVWGYLFLVLQCSLMALCFTGLIVGGAIGGAIVGMGVMLSMSVACSNKLGTMSKVLYDIVIFIMTFMVMYGIGFFLRSL